VAAATGQNQSTPSAFCFSVALISPTLRFMEWNRRIVQLTALMKHVAANAEVEKCRSELLAADGDALDGGELQRLELLAVTENNAGLIHAKAHRYVAALEAFEASLSYEEQAAVARGISPCDAAPSWSTLMNVSAVLTSLGRHAEARAIVASLVTRNSVSANSADQDATFSTVDPVMEGEANRSRSVSTTGAAAWPSVPAYVLELAERQLDISDHALRSLHASRMEQCRSRASANLSRAQSRQSRHRPWRRAKARRDQMSGLDLSSVMASGGDVEDSGLTRNDLSQFNDEEDDEE
jgi:hypothetical protein